jgi:hypothetical protein
MSTDQFDDLVTGHLRATAPREAPARVFDAMFDRISSTPQRGAGWRLGRVGGLLAAAAVVVLAVVAGTQLAGLIDGPVGNDPSASPSVAPTESGGQSPSAAPSTTPPPPVATEPATSGDALLLRVVTLGGPTDPVSMLPGTTVTADGTVIWRPVSTTEFAGYLTRRLTPVGLAELRQVIFGDALLDADATYELEPLPDAEPPGRGGFAHTFTVGEGADEVVVTSVGWLGDEEEAMYYQPAPERKALDEQGRLGGTGDRLPGGRVPAGAHALPGRGAVRQPGHLAGAAPHRRRFGRVRRPVRRRPAGSAVRRAQP